jgi:putative phosphoribosyl transferase
MYVFRDRRDAGRRLAVRLEGLRDQEPVVLGLPRGGVPVADEVARLLDAPLDVIVVRKLGVPFQPELGMGAIGEDGVRILNHDVLRVAHIGADELGHVEARERAEVEARAVRFRGNRPRIDLTGRTAIIVDDGIATGGTARAALQVARVHGAARVVLAVPVAPPSTVQELATEADEVVCLEAPARFSAVGEWYEDFSQVSDDEVVKLLTAAATRGLGDPPADAAEAGRDDDVELRVGSVRLFGHLTIPRAPIGLVLFAHGSGSSRHSPRNRFVAHVLNQHRLATLLFDLLSPDEEIDRRNVFDVGLLAERLVAATEWTRRQYDSVPVGYFGASTGAAAALWAAADQGNQVGAVVSRGGRPDLARPRLGEVTAPTLLIVGGRDETVIQLNREAERWLRCEHRLEIVPGATHLFEEPGTLETVATLATEWFTQHLTPRIGTFGP